MKEEILIDVILIMGTIGIAKIVDVCFGRFKRAVRAVLGELDRHYLCGHRLSAMVIEDFFGRFRDYNDEGFCYTFSAVVMLSLKRFRTARLVRGNIRHNNYGYHSWVEIWYLGEWYVIDLSLNDHPILLIPRRIFYAVQRPELMLIYSHRKFWADPAAKHLYERIQKPELSRVFVDVWAHYTPRPGKVEIADMNTPIELLEASGLYYLFPPDTGYKFSQRIVNEFMARPERKQPKRRTLRRLAGYYKSKQD